MAKSIDWKALEKKQGTVVKATAGADVIQLEKGESFIGQYVGSEEVQIGDNDPFMSLQFITEKGQQCISGTQLVQQMRMINKGSIVRITNNGKKKTNSGYKVNQFNVELLEGSINEKEREKIQKEIKEAMKKKSSKKGKK